MNRRTALVPVIVAALALTTSAALHATRRGPSALPFYSGSDLTPRWIARESPDYPAIHRIADWSLVDQTGNSIGARDLDGKIYVASFFFTNCRGFCPTLRSNLTKVAEAFHGDSDVAILSHTVTPEIDDAGRLAAYAARNGIHAPQWRLLTGNIDQIARLAHDSYFVKLSDSTGSTTDLRHTETVVLVDGERRIRGVYDGTVLFDVNRLIEDIRMLRAERR